MMSTAWHATSAEAPLSCYSSCKLRVALLLDSNAYQQQSCYVIPAAVCILLTLTQQHLLLLHLVISSSCCICIAAAVSATEMQLQTILLHHFDCNCTAPAYTCKSGSNAATTYHRSITTATAAAAWLCDPAPICDIT